MAMRSLTLREATDADLRPFHALAIKVWSQLGVAFDPDFARFRRIRDGRHRIVVLWQDDQLVAALVAIPIATDRGPGFEIKAFVVDQDLQDKTTLLDALSLYAMNIALAEGRTIVVSHRPRRIAGTVYGRDKLGMDTTRGDDAYIHQIGYAPDMMARIFQRHPEWQLP